MNVIDFPVALWQPQYIKHSRQCCLKRASSTASHVQPIVAAINYQHRKYQQKDIEPFSYIKNVTAIKQLNESFPNAM